MPLTEPQGQALARLLHLLTAADPRRPVAWDELGCLRALEAAAGRDAFDVAMAAIRASSDLGAKTPGVIPSEGPHWAERLSAARAPRNPLPHEECKAHPGQFRLSCGPCWSERKAPVPAEPAPRLARDDALAVMRQTLAAAPLCSHGVTFDHCREKSHDEEDR